MNARRARIVIIVAVFVLGVGFYFGIENGRQRAVEEAITQVVDACSTGNRMLFDEKYLEAQAVFRRNLSKSDAYTAEIRMDNRLIYIGCKK